MEIIDSLNFVKGAVAKKDFIPSMTHFYIGDGSIQAFNGRISLQSPIDLNIRCNPKAEQMIKAINACKSVVNITQMSEQELVIKSGRFKSSIDCLPDGVVSTKPSGDFIDIDMDTFMSGIKKLIRFVGNDASRPWSNGIQFREGSLYATNNICLTQFWVGSLTPTINIPEIAIDELLRLKEQPVAMQVSNNTVTFHYDDSRWLCSQLIDAVWPDVSRILDIESEQKKIPNGFFEAVETVKPFCEKTKTIKLSEEVIETIGDKITTCEVEGLNPAGCYDVDMMLLLKGVADTMEFKEDSRRSIFFGNNLRGAIVGRHTL